MECRSPQRSLKKEKQSRKISTKKRKTSKHAGINDWCCQVTGSCEGEWMTGVSTRRKAFSSVLQSILSIKLILFWDITLFSVFLSRRPRNTLFRSCKIKALGPPVTVFPGSLIHNYRLFPFFPEYVAFALPKCCDYYFFQVLKRNTTEKSETFVDDWPNEPGWKNLE